MKFLPLLRVLLLGYVPAYAQAPILTALSPSRNAVAAPRTAPLAVTFSQLLQNTLATRQAVRVFSQQRGGLMFGATRGAATVSGNVISFDPINDFNPGETVMVTTTTGATATNGAALARGHVHQFTAAVVGGTGSFVVPALNPDASVGRGPHGMAVGDVDGDGDLDLLTANYNIVGTVSIRFNDGTGSFSGTQNISVGDHPNSVVLGDVDADGDLDLLTPSQIAIGTVSVRFNDGVGVFSGTTSVRVGRIPWSVALGDVDADGDLDVLAANQDDNTVSVRLNDGAGTFSGTQNVGVGTGPRSVAVGDVDGDGDLDLLTANPFASPSAVSVRLNDGNGTFSGTQEVRVGGSAERLIVGDVDGDGDLDLLTSHYFSANTVSVRFNDGAGTFSGTQTVGVGNLPYDVVVGDVDGDGDLDLFTTNVNAGTVSIRLNNGSGTFSGTTDVRVGTSLQRVALGDVDGDGDLDLLASNGVDTTVSIRLNGGTGPTLATALAPASAEAAADVYPNPAPDGRFTVRAGQPGARYTVLNAVGRAVGAGALTGVQTALDLRHQPPGLYLLLLKAADGRTVTRRLMR